MDKDKLISVAKQLVAEGRGILAADESFPSIKKRFDKIGIESTEESRRKYRDLLLTTPEMEKYISGVILFDETIRQTTTYGKPIPQYLHERGILPGIKVDKGTVDLAFFPDEKITEGIDGLRERLSEYVSLGAAFTKWRAVITVGAGIPTLTCINSNVELLSRFAALSQEAVLVPIVEPEILMDGDHDIGRCEEVTTAVLKTLFASLEDHKVIYEGMLLKVNMIVSGKENQSKATLEEIAELTLHTLTRSVPAQVPGVVFLSGGLTPEDSTLYLNEINKNKADTPWQISFSFGRALQEPVLSTWQGKEENRENSQQAFLKRVKLNSLAREGKYNISLENE